MKGDIGTARLVSNVHGVSAFQEWIRERTSTDSSHLPIFDVSGLTKSPSVCLGCFDITQNEQTGSTFTEEFSLPEDKAFILDRIGILAPGDGVLSANFSGGTLPYPSLCQFRVWATNLHAVTGCFEELTPLLPNSFGSIFYYQKQTFVSDRIIIQGSFSVLTVCIIGWPVDIDSDVRWMVGKKFHQFRLSHCLGRSAFLPSIPDPCPQDASLIKTSLSCLQVEPLQRSSLSNEAVEKIRNDSCFTKVSDYFHALNASELNALLAKELPDDASSQQLTSLPVPSVLSLQRITAMALNYVRELHVVLSHANVSSLSEQDVNRSIRYSILKSACFRRLFSLMFWPLENNATYSRYLGLVQSPEYVLMATEMLEDNLKTPTHFLPLDPFNATLKQKRICLRLLCSLLSVSTVVVDLLGFFGGHWALFNLADLGETINEPGYSWPYPTYNWNKYTHADSPVVPFVLKTSALECLVAFSTHHLGSLLLSYPSPFSVSQPSIPFKLESSKPISLYKRLVKYALVRLSFSQSPRKRMLGRLFNNVLLCEAVQGFRLALHDISVQHELTQINRKHLLYVVEALSLLMIYAQCHPSNTESFPLCSRIRNADDLIHPEYQSWTIRPSDCEEAVKNFLALTNIPTFCSDLFKLQSILNQLKLSDGNHEINLFTDGNESCESTFSRHFQYIHERLSFFLKGDQWFEKLQVFPFPLLVDAANTLNHGLVDWLCTTSTGVAGLMSQCCCSSCKDSHLAIVYERDVRAENPDCLFENFSTSIKSRIQTFRTASQLVVKSIQPNKDSSESKGKLYLSRFNLLCFPSLLDRISQEGDGHPITLIFSFQELFRLSVFLKNRINVDIFLRVWGSSVTFCATLGQSLYNIVSRQYWMEQEQKKLIELPSSSTAGSKKSFEEIKSDLASLAAVGHLVYIIWKLWMQSEESYLLILLTSYCFDAIMFLCATGCSSIVDCCEAPSTHEGNEKASVACKMLNRLQKSFATSPSSWGSVDLTFQAYRNLHGSSNETQEDVSMLNYLVPASLFTTLEQIFDCDVSLVHQCYDLLKGMSLVESYITFYPFKRKPLKYDSQQDASLHPAELINILETFDGPKTLFPDQCTLENKPESQHTFLSSAPSCGLKFLLSQLIAMSTSLLPNHIIPFTETAQINQPGSSRLSRYTATATPKTSVSLTALRLGGYRGALGVPILEPQYVTTKEAKSDSNAIEIKRLSSYSVLKSELYTTLKLILKLVKTHTPEAAQEELLMSLHDGDERLAFLQNTSLEAPHLLFQNAILSISSAVLRLLNFCSACLCPSLFLGHSGQFVHSLTGQDAQRYSHFASDILPLTIITLEFFYRVLDLIFLPVHSHTKSSHHILIDSSLQHTLILLTSRLLQLFVLTSRSEHHPSPMSSKDQALLLEEACWDKDLSLSLDIVSSIVKLLCSRCPDASVSFLECVLRQSRIFPSNFILAPFIVSCLNGLGLLFPEPGVVMQWSQQCSPLIAPELNGAEGRNLDAIVARLKQNYIQRRHSENPQVSLVSEAHTGSSAISRLPTSMTTLCLSTAICFPLDMEQILKMTRKPLYLQVKISLATPLTPSLTSINRRSQDEKLIGFLYDNCIPQRHLGRLSMGNDSDLLSFSVFDPASHFLTSKEQNVAYTDPATSVAEWSAWDRVWELLNNSLGEEAIDSSLQPECVSAVPFGLSANTILEVTGSPSLVKEMFKQLNGEQIDGDKTHVERLNKISRLYKQMTIENIGEFVELLLISSYTSNHLLHAATAKALALLAWSNGPPVLDLVMHYAQCLTTELYGFLSCEFKQGNFGAVSHIFLLGRLILLIDHAFSFIPFPTLEATTCLIQLASTGLQALQNVPDLDSGGPKALVVTGIFDCLLPAFVRVLRRAIETFEAFLFQYTKKFQVHDTGTEPSQECPSQDASKTSQVSGQQCYLERNFANQFSVFFGKQSIFPKSSAMTPALLSGASGLVTHTVTASSSTAPNIVSSSSNKEASNDVVFSEIHNLQTFLRLCCSGLSSIINQLPITWGIFVRRVPCIDLLASSMPEWSGLSLYTIKEILNVFNCVAQSRILCYISLFDLDRHFLHEFLLAWKSADLSTSVLNFSAPGKPDPTIRLEGFLVTLTEFLMGPYEDINSQWPGQVCEAVLNILEMTVSICSNIIVNTPLDSARLLLCVTRSDLISHTCHKDSFYSSETSPIEWNAQQSDSVAEPIMNQVELAKQEFLSSVSIGLKSFYNQYHEAPSTRASVSAGDLKRISHILKRIERLKDFVMTHTTHQAPPREIIGSQIVECFQYTYSYASHIKPFYRTPTQMGMVCNIPWVVCLSFNPCESPSKSINSLAQAMKQDPLWILSAVLEKMAVAYNIENASENSLLRQEPPTFSCLSSVMWSQAAQYDIAPSGVLSSPLHDTLILTRRPNQHSLGRPIATSSTSNEVTLTDTFRTRKGPSSRAPSKHVDEFEAQQAKLYTATKTKSDSSINDASFETSLEPSLEAIPEWKEFVTNGKAHGLDVMRILKTPQLLQDPALESRFRFLVDLHPTIKTLFNMMELEMVSS